MGSTNKMKTKQKIAKFRLKLEVDTSGWGSGGWPDDLEKAMSVELDRDNASVTFEINDELWEQAALKIAKEAIEAFFEDGIFVSLTKDGVRFAADDGIEFLVDFSKIWCDMGRKDRDALVRALNANSYDSDDNYELVGMDQLVRMADASEATR